MKNLKALFLFALLTLFQSHDFGTKSTKQIEKELLSFSKERKMELILPCLYSELNGDALPKIVSEIAQTNYLHHIIIGLDQANEKQARKACLSGLFFISLI